jgi:hypothetical protein
MLVTTIPREQTASLSGRGEGDGITRITSKRIEQPVTPDQRRAARRRDFSWVNTELNHLRCWHRVWDEGDGELEAARYHEVVEKERTHFCFLFPYRRGMLNPAASALQKRAENRWGARRDRRLTIIGLWIAAIALATGVALKNWKLGSDDMPRTQSVKEESRR